MKNSYFPNSKKTFFFRDLSRTFQTDGRIICHREWNAFNKTRKKATPKIQRVKCNTKHLTPKIQLEKYKTKNITQKSKNQKIQHKKYNTKIQHDKYSTKTKHINITRDSIRGEYNTKIPHTENITWKYITQKFHTRKLQHKKYSTSFVFVFLNKNHEHEHKTGNTTHHTARMCLVEVTREQDRKSVWLQPSI